MAEVEELTAEDKAWFEEPVSVQVAPDEQRWLDTMMEMRKEEFLRYAVYQYGIPENAIKASTRNEGLQLVLLANRAGGGGSVLQTRYKYLNDLKGIVPAAITVRKGGRHLYLTRGEGDNLQVFNKESSEWIPYTTLKPKIQSVQHIASEAANASAPNEPSKSNGVNLSTLAPLIPKMNGEQLRSVAREVGLEGYDDAEKFPTNASLIEALQAKAEGDN